MQMPYFLSKLMPPRKSFLRDMAPEELDVMRAHQDYWRAHVDAGMVIVIGSVDDPEGAWGVAISDVPSRERLEALQLRDPVILSERGFRYQNFAMPAVRVCPIEPMAPVSSVTP
jgi:hypothetical protein